MKNITIKDNEEILNAGFFAGLLVYRMEELHGQINDPKEIKILIHKGIEIAFEDLNLSAGEDAYLVIYMIALVLTTDATGLTKKMADRVLNNSKMYLPSEGEKIWELAIYRVNEMNKALRK
jgi:hypothetical protein